jgi:cell division protein FtsB
VITEVSVKIPKLDRFRIAMGAGILLTIVIVVGLGWAFFQQLTLAEELRMETKGLEQAVATQRAHQAHLTATLTYVHTDSYAEEWAREEARMVKPGEVLVIPVGERGDAGPALVPTARPDGTTLESESRPFWVVWWQALVGPEE